MAPTGHPRSEHAPRAVELAPGPCSHRLVQEPVLEVLENDRERGAVKKDLAVGRQEADDLLDERLELGAEQLVGLVHDEDAAVAQLAHALAGEVEDTTRGGDQDMHNVVEAHDVVLQGGAARRDHHLHAEVLAQLLAHLGCLQGELSGGDQQDRCRAVAAAGQGRRGRGEDTEASQNRCAKRRRGAARARKRGRGVSSSSRTPSTQRETGGGGRWVHTGGGHRPGAALSLTLDGVFCRVDALQHRDGEGGRFAGAVLGAGQDVAPGERYRDTLLLDGRGL